MAQRLGNVAVGTLLKLNESGVPVEYRVVHQGIPGAMYDGSCNGTWLWRKDAKLKYPWFPRDKHSNIFERSNVFSYLNVSFLNEFDPDIKALIKQVKIPYHKNGGMNGTDQSGADGLLCKVFLLCAREVGFDSTKDIILPFTGTKLDYFEAGTETSANRKRIVTLDELPYIWWHRDPTLNSVLDVCVTTETGMLHHSTSISKLGVCPAFILPANLVVNDDGSILPDTYPEPPTSITVPNSAVPTGSSIAVSWAAVIGATYKLQRSVDGESWTDVYNGGNTAYTDTAGAWNRVKYRVASVKNGVVSGFLESREVQILKFVITQITVPSQVMEGQQIPVSWKATVGADTYVLERKANSGSWTQIYSGSALTFTDTPAGGWTSVQYQVKAGKDGLFGEYKQSAVVPVISAAALVISGQNEDLGTITKDVPYTVSSNTGNPITLERYVNGTLAAKLTVKSGFAYSIPVMELPTGAGTIKIVCSVTPSGLSPVSATRIWSYNKTVVQFPEEGGPTVLYEDGRVVLPITIAEAVRTPSFMGGSLDKTLEQIHSAVDRVNATAGSGAITAGDVGAAPSGFGLGETPPLITDFDDAVLPGWYQTNGDTVNGPGINATYGDIGSLIVSSHASNRIIQMFFGYSPGGIQNIHWVIRGISAGTSGPWEWVNPPLSLGVEYRTVERYQGKPVYVKAVNLGTGPDSNTLKEVAHDIVGLGHIVDFGGEMYVSTGSTNPISLPGISYRDIENYHFGVDYVRFIWRASATRLTSYTGIGWVKYTKTTD